MTRVLMCFAALLLAGCANDRYVALDGASPGLMAATLRTCKRQTMDAYFDQQHHGAATVGAVLGGALGGAIGGIVDGTQGKIKLSDLNPMIEACMRSNGYEGTSEN